MEYTKIKDGEEFEQLMQMIEIVVIPEGYKTIKNEVFAGYYTSLKKIVCPSSLIEAKARCFSCCNPVEEIILNEGLKIIGDECFQSTPTLKNLTIPSTVETIGTNAFRGCYGLETVVINQPENSINGAPWGAPDTTTITWVG